MPQREVVSRDNSKMRKRSCGHPAAGTLCGSVTGVMALAVAVVRLFAVSNNEQMPQSYRRLDGDARVKLSTTE